MKELITFKELSKKLTDIKWSSTKNIDDTHQVSIVFGDKYRVILSHVPCQYVDEDGKFEQKILNEEESLELIDKRIQSLIQQLQQCIFTVKFYGGNIEGTIRNKY